MTVAKNSILIAGPTASGKSALALELAEETGAMIVNADSMQVYDLLRVITARPGNDEMRRVPHRLYGHVHPASSYSVAAWLADVEKLVASNAGGRRMIFTGGTGLYFRALAGGISDMPDIPDSVRERWRYRLAEEGSNKLHRLLWRVDPVSAETLNPADGQRIVRALEVCEASGKPLSYWQELPGRPLIDNLSARKILIMPDRDKLALRIDLRFDTMIGAGALQEVEQLLALKLDPTLPALKAIGVRELGSYLKGEIAMEEALEMAKAATRQYAKRQRTWFRNQLDPSWQRR